MVESSAGRVFLGRNEAKRRQETEFRRQETGDGGLRPERGWWLGWIHLVGLRHPALQKATAASGALALQKPILAPEGKW